MLVLPQAWKPEGDFVPVTLSWPNILHRVVIVSWQWKYRIPRRIAILVRSYSLPARSFHSRICSRLFAFLPIRNEQQQKEEELERVLMLTVNFKIRCRSANCNKGEDVISLAFQLCISLKERYKSQACHIRAAKIHTSTEWQQESSFLYHALTVQFCSQDLVSLGTAAL